MAYFSPVRPTTLKYREKQVWFALDAGSNVAGPRLEFDYNAVTSGTLQHEVFETESITVWDENSSLVIMSMYIRRKLFLEFALETQ